MRKIVIDLDALLADGTLSPELAGTLAARAIVSGRASLFVNILLVFGAICVAAGVLALAPSATTGLILAVTALGAATVLKFVGGAPWRVLSQGLAIMGTLGMAGWVTAEIAPDSMIWAPALIFAMMTAGAMFFRNAFLATLAVVSFGALLGTGTLYWHASYAIFVREATLSIAALGTLATGLYFARSLLGEAWESLTTAAARTAVMLVNMAFWVGSLWGDYIGEQWAAGEGWRATRDWRETALYVPEAVFSVGWAAVLIGAIALTRRGGFVSTASIVFLAIHGYTQFFEVLGASPTTLIIGGAVAVGLAAWLGRRLVTSQQESLVPVA